MKTMASQWTNKYAILRDLSFAQGRKVPAEIVGSVGIGEKPPASNIEEETEEEYIQNGGDGELHTKPDLSMIKHMLDWVNEVEVVNDDDIDKLVEISKLNPSCGEFLPKPGTNNGTLVPNNVGSGDKIVLKSVEASLNSGTHVDENMGSGVNNGTKEIGANNVKISDDQKFYNVNCKANLKKKRRERNAVLIDLLEKEQLSLKDYPPEGYRKIEVIKSVNTTSTKTNKTKQNTETPLKDECKEVKLLKPNDFMIQMINSDSTVTQAVEKVTEWLQNPVDQQPKMKAFTVPPSNMFKKKTITPILESGCMFKRKSDTSSIKSSDSDSVRNWSNSTFVPSTQANEYYKKYVERSQVQKTLQEDIWEKAERVMKEIDAKRLKEKEDKIGQHLSQIITSTDQADANSDIADANSEEADANSEAAEVNSNKMDDNSDKLDATLKQSDADSEQGDANSELNEGNNSSALLQADPQGLDLVRLPQHRHELPEECKVCLVLARYRPSELDSLHRF